MRNVPRMLSSRRAVVVYAVAIIALTTGAGYAAATIPDANGVYHGCYLNTSPHTLSLVGGSTCPSGSTNIHWNQRGPRGFKGEPGTPGTPGLSGFHTVVESTGTVPAGNIGAIDVPCADGQTAISAGYSVPYTATVLENHPRSDNASIWTISAAFPSS